MGKFNRPLIISILIILIFTNFAMAGENESSVKQKAYDLGYKDGEKAGLENNENKPYYLALPEKDEIINKFSKEYEEKIDEENIPDILKYYEYGFKDGYEDAKKDDKKEIKLSYAQDLGKTLGEIYGYSDFYSERNSNWTRAIPSNRELVRMYNLDREDYIYRYDFLDSFREYFEIGYREGFEKANLEPKKVSYQQGLEDGENFGEKLGTIYGANDYFQKRSLNYDRDLPSDREIEREYSLNYDEDKYREGFLVGFKRAYEEAYNKSYRDSNKQQVETPDLNGNENGKTIGHMKGEYAAIIDLTLGQTNSWTRHRVQDKVIIEEYGLDFQSNNYSTAFIIGYWDGFMESYNENYKKLQLDSNKVKTHTEKVSIDGKTNIGIPEDDKFLVDIDAGTYYNDVIVTVDSIPTSYINPNSPRHTQASGIYGLKILNTAGTLDKNKNISIKFKSYGNHVKYGIYKYHYNKWIYIPSEQEGDYLIADINLDNINAQGNIYVVRVDNELPIFFDSRGHWAKDEINTYVKREIIYGYPDGNFKPNNEITRREFLTMLSRLYDWYPPYDSSNIENFKDYKEFGYGEKAISYAVYHNIVKGYSDNTFRPNNPISYKEVEIIMSRVLKNEKFNWDYYAKKILYEEGVRSKSFNSKNNKITRGEFVYMLHRLNEWQY